MNREIKFRVWDKKKNQWLQDSWFEYNFGFPPNHKFLELDDKDLVYQQFTGLKDKNGKEIYEGDILKQVFGYKELYLVKFGEHCNELNEDSGNGWHGVTSHKSDCIKKEDIDSISYGTYGLISGDNFEIIGNIYENPELLKTNP